MKALLLYKAAAEASAVHAVPFLYVLHLQDWNNTLYAQHGYNSSPSGYMREAAAREWAQI